MQYSSIFTILALAMAAAAAPSEKAVRTGGGNCNSQTANTCCDGLLNCVVQIAGHNCDGTAWCCDTTAPQVRHHHTYSLAPSLCHNLAT
jgi:hypothetical protein